MNKNDTPTHTSAYGGRPIWQWLLIYAVVGGAIYAAVYLFLYNKPASGYKYPAAASAQSQPAAAAPAAAASPAMTPAMTPATSPAYSRPAMPTHMNNTTQGW